MAPWAQVYHAWVLGWLTDDEHDALLGLVWFFYGPPPGRRGG